MNNNMKIYKRKKLHLDKTAKLVLIGDDSLLRQVNKEYKGKDFIAFLMKYQLKHYEKYGQYLEI